MTDDLVQRLRDMHVPNVWEAADRIETLETALKNVGILIFGANEDVVHVIRAALAGEKKDG